MLQRALPQAPGRQQCSTRPAALRCAAASAPRRARCRSGTGSARQRGAATRAAGMQEEAVTFTNDRGERLAGTLLWPAQQQGADAAAAAGSTHGGGVPCVLLAHGYMSGRSSELLVRLATALGREGIASLRWDFSGNGDSEGRFKYGCYRDEAEEVRCAAAWAAQRGARVVGLVGHSKGATTALLYASKYHDLPRVVNLAGRFDVRQGVQRRLGSRVLLELEEKGQVEMPGRSRARGPFTWTLTKEDLADRLATDVGAACAAIPASVRVLTCHGTDDGDVPVGEAAKFAAAISNHELLIIEGGDHSFSSSAAQYQLLQRVTALLAGADA